MHVCMCTWSRFLKQHVAAIHVCLSLDIFGHVSQGRILHCGMFSLENPHESELRQKLELLGDPDRILANPWHNEHGLNQREDVTNCQWTAWVPIPFGHGSPWEASAQSLGDFHTESSHWHMVWMLQFLIMVCEDHDLGTPSFQIDQHRNKRLWKRLIRAYVMNVYFNDKSKPTKDLLEMFLRRSPKFDPTVTEMIEEMRRVIEKERIRDASNGSDNDDHVRANNNVAEIPDALRGQLPTRLPTESAQDYQLRIEQQRVQDEVRRMQEDMARRVQELIQQHPEWTPQQAQAQAQEEMNQQNEAELDALFDEFNTMDFGENEDGVMQMEERKGQQAARQRVLHIKPRADGRRHESDDRFGNAIETDGRVAQAVLCQSNDHAQQQPRRRIPAR